MKDPYKGRTALFWACLHGNAGAIHLLLSAGADPLAVDKQGLTPLGIVKRSGSPACLKYFRVGQYIVIPAGVINASFSAILPSLLYMALQMLDGEKRVRKATTAMAVTVKASPSSKCSSVGDIAAVEEGSILVEEVVEKGGGRAGFSWTTRFPLRRILTIPWK